MTLDPVHIEGVADLARRVATDVDETDQTDIVERAWSEFLDPLYGDDGSVFLEPLDEQTRTAVNIADVALTETGFPTQHGLDSGTINPTTFQNGLVVDVSQAALASVPSSIDLHRARTIVMAAHSNDPTAAPGTDDWFADDEGYTRRRILGAPRVDRYEQTVVHALALYMAESEHALAQGDLVEDILILDGPLYPTGLLKWVERDPELKRLIIERQEFVDVITNYLALVEEFVDREVPLLGFVKNSAARGITRTLRSKVGAPWVDDDAFFRRVLSQHDDDGELQTNELTFTNWFRSRVGTDGVIWGDDLRLDHDFALDREAYEVTFFVVYDPRDDLIYRIEAPLGVTEDDDRREELTRFVLSEIAAERGPPAAVRKADELAKIDQQGKATLRERIEREFDTSQRQRYNDVRWGPIDTMEL